jgi:hypothetical protein
VIHIEHLLHPLHRLYFHLWLIYWIFLVTIVMRSVWFQLSVISDVQIISSIFTLRILTVYISMMNDMVLYGENFLQYPVNLLSLPAQYASKKLQTRNGNLPRFKLIYITHESERRKIICHKYLFNVKRKICILSYKYIPELSSNTPAEIALIINVTWIT